MTIHVFKYDLTTRLPTKTSIYLQHAKFAFLVLISFWQANKTAYLYVTSHYATQSQTSNNCVLSADAGVFLAAVVWSFLLRGPVTVHYSQFLKGKD